ncbi:hypothetical protein B4N84_07690 [Flavobacterium sp. IR1]|nr:hypothetical protein B4N84_07690 [Flavobacterium sp. IR1]
MNKIQDVVTLLRVAMSLEALTIPPYLTAYWSIKDNPTITDNQEAKRIIHSVAMEEMLHMMSVGNILASLGACPLYYNKCNTLENWGKDKLPILGFPVDLAPFSVKQIEKFLEIEKPIKPIDLSISSRDSALMQVRALDVDLMKEIKKLFDFFQNNTGLMDVEISKITNDILAKYELESIFKMIDINIKGNIELILELKLFFIKCFSFKPNEDIILNDKSLKKELDKCKSIGEFYHLLIKELRKLEDKDFKESGFKQLDLSHDPRVGTIEQRTIPSFIVDSKEKAIKLLEWVVDQGEGSEVPMDNDGDLAHYYRFQQIAKGMKIKSEKNGDFFFDKNESFVVNEQYVHRFGANDYRLSHVDSNGLQDNFNSSYFTMFKELQAFYLTGNRRYIMQSFDYMMKMSTNAELLMDKETCPSFSFKN